MKYLRLTILVICILINGINVRGYNAQGFAQFDGLKHNGRVTNYAVNESDSVLNLAEVSQYGRDVEWQTVLVDSLTLLENRGFEWLIHKDTLGSVAPIHYENSRERRNICLRDSSFYTVDSIPMNYRSKTRRDMSFHFNDYGNQHLSQFTTPLLILSEGDTLRNVAAIKIVTNFRRNLISERLISDSIYCSDNNTKGTPIASFTESETKWLRPGTQLPAAVVFQRTTTSATGQTKETGWTAVFPTDLNKETIAQYIQNVNKNKYPDSNTQTYKTPRSPHNPDNRDYSHDLLTDATTTPSINIDGKTLSITVSEDAELTISNSAGILYLHKQLKAGSHQINLSDLPVGEYAIKLSTATHTNSMTIHF